MRASRRRVRGVTLLAAVAAAGVLASAATANAAILSPSKFDFGEHEVGTISAPQGFTLEVQCAKYNFEIFICEAFETVKTSISASPPFAVQSTDCPAELVGFSSFPTFCTIKVVFQPTVAGPVTGKLNTGGPTAELLGTGLAIPGAGGGPPPAASSPPASSPPSSSPPATASPPPPPSNQLGFAKPKLDKHHGTATLTVTVPGPGTLALAGNSILVPRVAVGPVSPLITVQAAGQVKLRIRAKGKAKTTLARTGKVTVKATVTFTPTGGTGAGYIEPIHLVKTS